MTKPWRYALSVVLCEAAGMIGAPFVTNAMGWFSELAKPSFNPPSWVFAPMWTLLYALMGIAFVLMHDRRQSKHKKLETEEWFFAQLALNMLWTPVFFGLHNAGLALVVICALWIAIVGTIVRFQRVSKLAAWLLVPYLAWVSFALVLNFAIWWMNG